MELDSCHPGTCNLRWFLDLWKICEPLVLHSKISPSDFRRRNLCRMLHYSPAGCETRAAVALQRNCPSDCGMAGFCVLDWGCLGSTTNVPTVHRMGHWSGRN